jgi:hypothetical protein
MMMMMMMIQRQEFQRRVYLLQLGRPITLQLKIITHRNTLKILPTGFAVLAVAKSQLPWLLSGV